MQPGKERPKILIVDDEKINIDVLVGLLNPDYKTVVAKNGEQAFMRLEKPPLPDLILLDIMMPGIDGLEVCRRLKLMEKVRHVPVIFITAKSTTGEIVKGFKLGAVDYITKPFQPEELAARVSTHIKLKKTITELENAHRELKTLKGLLPICSSCKKIRDDQGYWNQIETYISDHSDAEFTHSICPDCIKKLYPQIKIPGS